MVRTAHPTSSTRSASSPLARQGVMGWTPPCDEVGIGCAIVAGVRTQKEESAMKSTTIAVDLAKSVFQVAVSEHPGKVAQSHRLTRSQFLRFLAERQPALVLMEACGTAHF